jgi:hypothetical protein
MNFSRTKIIPSAAMGVSTIYSQQFSMEKFAGCSFQPVWTGTPTGTFNVWVSNDYGSSPALTNDANPFSVGTWTNLGVSIPVNPSGVSGNTFIPVYASCCYHIILQYVGTAGAGVLGGYFAGKYNG